MIKLDREIDMSRGKGERARARKRRYNGGVIPPEDAVRLFEPFRARPGGRGRRGSSGLGLGLYIARLMTEAHGGRIDVRSSAAEGTTFQVRLPRVSAEVPPSSGEPVWAGRADGR